MDERGEKRAFIFSNQMNMFPPYLNNTVFLFDP